MQFDLKLTFEGYTLDFRVPPDSDDGNDDGRPDRAANVSPRPRINGGAVADTPDIEDMALFNRDGGFSHVYFDRTLNANVLVVFERCDGRVGDGRLAFAVGPVTVLPNGDPRPGDQGA